MTRPRLPYSPAIDGLRAVAVLLVVGFHAGLGWLRGGFLGVDVFFVVSGYLITALLLNEWQHDGRIGLRAFWARRARRLLPALLVMVVAVAVTAAAVEGAAALEALRRQALATLAYVANWQLLQAGDGYFAVRDPSPLQHTWSLAIEEQFYVVWPLVVVLCLRSSQGVRRLAQVTVGSFVGSVALMAWLAEVDGTSRAYYGADTRLQAIAAGSLLAIVLHRHAGISAPVARRAVGAAAVLGGVVVLVAARTVTGQGLAFYRGGFAAIAVASVALVAGVQLLPGSRGTRLLATPALVWVGRRSYGIYLWHWPVFVFVNAERSGLSGNALLALRLGVTAVLTVASYALVEQPLRVRRWASRAVAVGLAPAAMAAAAAIVLVATTATPDGDTALSSVSTVIDDDPIPRGERRTLLVGDSVAQTVGLGLGPFLAEHGIELVNRAELGCGALPHGEILDQGKVATHRPECAAMFDQWERFVEEYRPDSAIVLLGRWEVMDRKVDGRWSRIGEPAFDRLVTDALGDAVDRFRRHGVAVVLATAPYYDSGEQADGDEWPQDDPTRVDRFNRLVRAVARETGSEVLELNALLADAGRFTQRLDGVKVRWDDGVHITPEGGRRLGPAALVALG